MFKMNHRSLRFRLAGIFVGFSLLIAVLFTGTMAIWLSQNLEQQYIANYAPLVDFFAEQAFYNIDILQNTALEDVIENMVGAEIVYAQIVNEGSIIGSTVIQDGFPQIDLPIRSMPIAIQVSKRSAPGNLPYLDLTRGIRGRPSSNENIESYVRIGVSLTPLHSLLSKQLQTLILIGIFIVIVGAVMGFLIFAGIWSPIRQLIDAVQRFGQGDLAAQAPDNRSDELGLLAKEFNQMATRIAQKNHELENLNSELQKANRAKTEFLTVMSHELRTPLNAILGYTELLDQGKFGELADEQHRPLRRMLRAGEHLLSLIENTLSYAKLELGVEKLHIVETDGSRIILECIEQLQPIAAEREIELIYKGSPVTINADAMKLKQILLNLIQNAIQHSNAGQVVVESEDLGTEIALRVTDSGLGIKPDEVSELFDPFVRGSGEIEQSLNGVGLGLAVVDQYTKMHQGSVEVKTGTHGTTFTIRLPKNAMKGGNHDGRSL